MHPATVNLDTLRKSLEDLLNSTLPLKAKDGLRDGLRILDTVEGKLNEGIEASRLAAIYNVMQSMGALLELDVVLRQVIDAVITLTGAERSFLMLYDKKTDTISPRAARTSTGEDLGQQTPEVSYSVIRFVLENDQGLLATNAQDDPRFSTQASVISLSLRSVICAPLRSHGNCIGVIYADNRMRSGNFSKDDLSLLDAFAIQAAIAIEQAQLYDKIQNQLKEQTLLRQSGEIISSSLEIHQVLNLIVEQLGKALDVTSAYICTYNQDTHSSTVVAEYIGNFAKPEEKISDLGASYNYSGDDVFVENMAKGRIYHYDLAASFLPQEEKSHLVQHGARTVLIIPLRFQEKTIAFVEIWESREQRFFTENELNLCQGIAQQAAIAIENARLFERAQKELAGRKRLESKLRYDATHDALTNLPNRAYFSSRLEEIINNQTHAFAVFFLDLDNFKMINDTLGHTIGDQFLIAIGERLSQSIPPNDTIARIGGDEFVLLFENIENAEDASKAAEKLLHDLEDPVKVGERTFAISTSIGIVLYEPSYGNPEEILRDADIAMYRAKDAGGSQYKIFDKAMREQMLDRMAIESDLKLAILRNELRIFYQPIMVLGNGQLYGLEALARWQHPIKGLMSPGSFIPIAEDTGLIIPIERWIIQTASQQLQQWRKKFPQINSTFVSVNLSRQHLEFPDIVYRIEQATKSVHISPTDLCIEITESAIIENITNARNILKQFKDLGIQIYMDDFGTGYSSLGYLSELPIDVLKIDRSFLQEIRTPKKYALMKTIITMGHELGLKVIAEGIENLNHMDELIKLQCELGQGFHFARPMDSSSTEQFIQTYLDRL